MVTRSPRPWANARNARQVQRFSRRTSAGWHARRQSAKPVVQTEPGERRIGALGDANSVPRFGSTRYPSDGILREQQQIRRLPLSVQRAPGGRVARVR
jgi:hypothetical protein